MLVATVAAGSLTGAAITTTASATPASAASAAQAPAPAARAGADRNALTLVAQYRWEMEGGASLTGRLEGRWASHYELTPQNNLFLVREKTARKDWINAFLTYEPADGDWKVQAWGRNVLDNKAVTFGTNYFFYLLTQAEFASGLNEVDRTSVTEGRTYGVTLTYRFQ